jgi:phosphoserine phosphatase RsbU/P
MARTPFQKIMVPSGLSESVAERLAKLTPVQYSAGTILFLEDGPGDRMYVLLEGDVEIIKALGSPDERLLHTLGPGEIVGEMSLLSPNGRRMASARASNHTSVIEITREDFDTILRRDPALAIELLHTVSDRLRDAQELALRDLRTKNERLAQAYAELQATQARLVEQERVTHEMLLARQIQERMLPSRMPNLPGIDLGALVLPAREVAGDFYDVFLLRPGELAIIVGDVCGKGVPAALYAAQVRGLLRSEAARSDSAAQALQRVNQLLIELNGEGMFVTLIYAVLEIETGQMTIARAGHELPLFWDMHGVRISVAVGIGHPLGMISEPAIDLQSVLLPPGSSMLLYTDGASEASRQDGTQFERERLLAAATSVTPTTAAQICTTILERLTLFRGERALEDDLTLVTLRIG